MKIVIGLSLIAFLAGCATAPQNIVPQKNDGSSYVRMTCEQLCSTRSEIERSLIQADQQQRSTRSTDIVGILLVGVPLGRATGGNREDEIAVLKGQDLAIESILKSNSCAISSTCRINDILVVVPNQ